MKKRKIKVRIYPGSFEGLKNKLTNKGKYFLLLPLIPGY